ncbi:putative ABC transport system permease protein [Clostridium amylolyticum]|uniref:Putative ABC transport system permease protein n=1 Tax=Clostridium amylolyticum TaxID=1121298 RepID=A0A1M6MTB9_9CLOT|nr:ABC transporter permease [Clostridium amylolyticum]SHJ86775.1 putative ABC transport system permease protein [Clostridium amylolyticum]
MTLLENFKMALDSIRSNKMRSFLTMLGIIIGISSVITILALGAGGKNTITGEFEKIGASTLSLKIDPQKASNSDYFTLEDVRTLTERGSSIKYVSPGVNKQGNATSQSKAKRAVITGGSVDLKYIQNTEILYGRFFNEREYAEGKPVIVIDEIAAKDLFGYKDVVGKSINLGNRNSSKKVEIIGVSKSSDLMFGGNENMPVFVMTPITFLMQLYPNDFVIDNITISATSKEKIEQAGNEALNILESRHGNRGREVYKAENLMKQLDQINQVMDIFTAFIGAVAAISLLVGGIGVMNIMLVSVTERTREIGIRKAIGATTNAILLQFLTESVIISLMGGIIGMILGIVGASVIGSFAKITPSVSFKDVIMVIIFSSAVGIFFGIYPARKAAKLNPIDALRYE